jgi:hypothetical protein
VPSYLIQNSDWLRAGRTEFDFRRVYGFLFSPPLPDRIWGPQNTSRSDLGPSERFQIGFRALRTLPDRIWGPPNTFRSDLGPSEHFQIVSGSLRTLPNRIWGPQNTSRSDLEPSEPESYGYRGCSPRINRPKREIEHSPLSTADIKGAWS